MTLYGCGFSNADAQFGYSHFNEVLMDTDSVSLTEEQQLSIFHRVYSRFLPIFSNDEVRESNVQGF